MFKAPQRTAPVTNADRALRNLPPRNAAPDGPFQSSLGRAVGLVVSWPERGEG